MLFNGIFESFVNCNENPGKFFHKMSPLWIVELVLSHFLL